MKRRLNKLILLIIMLLPVTVRAYSGSASISCSPTTVSPGGTTSCTIKGTIDGSDEVSEVELNAPVPMDVTELGMLMEANALQYMNA